MSDFLTRIEEFFGPGGLLEQRFPGFEYREGQARMALAVAQSLAENRLALIEAGTGVGKSFAYLIPSLLWSRERGERVVVSTFTVNLQEQLVKKDLPQVMKYLELPGKVALVKGWGNYLCRRKIHFLPRKQLNLNERAYHQLTKILTWLASHPAAAFSFSELPFQVSRELKEELSCEPDLCLSRKCPFFLGCAFHLARAEMEGANLLIVNHALLVCDLALQKEGSPGVIPAYSRLVVDEAHHLEEVASEYLGVELGHAELPKLLKRLLFSHSQGEEGASGAESGFLALLRSRLLNAALPEEAREYFKNNLDYLLYQVPSLAESWEDLFLQVKQKFRLQENRDARASQNGDSRPFLPVKPSLQETPEWELLDFSRQKLGSLLGQFSHRFFTLKDELAQLPPTPDGEFEQLLTDSDAYLKRMLRLREKLDFLFAADSPDFAFWLEAEEKKPRLRAIPYRVGEVLKEQLFTKLDSGVLTSATLAVKRDFSFLKNRLGLEGFETQTELLPSSFDYRSQASIFLPDDLPGPEEPGFAQALREILPPLLSASRGRAFVLFTAYGLLKQTAEYLKNSLPGEFSLLVQGETPRHKMLESFKSHPHPVLLGTDSFWEGVDVPGEALSLVVIARLPFKAPEDPVVLTQVEEMERAGLNSFWQLMLPRAALKLKQGFGRLIRRTTDRGAVVILDKRIFTKSYGSTFLSSLPPARKYKGGWRETVEQVGKFLAPVGAFTE